MGIFLRGGFFLKINFRDKRPQPQEIKTKLEPLGLGTVSAQPAGERGMIFRFRHIDEPTHQLVLQNIRSASGDFEELRFDTIGPTIGAELRQKAILALALAIAAIILYIAWAFRQVSKPVSSWKYGVVAVLALSHDVLIPTGIFALLGHFKQVEVDALFITALLTILGFSVHDTIVVFDRIRENLRKLKGTEVLEVTINRSMNETFARSLNTSLTVLLVLLGIFFFGGETTRYFALALIIGIFVGTYSSIFVASPLLVVWNSSKLRK